MMRRGLLVLVAGVLVGRAALALDIFSCGTDIPERETGVLMADLSCGGAFTGTGVRVLNRATLEMNGHTITGGLVACLGRHCTVTGPGEITNCSYGVTIGGVATTLTISDVDIHDCSRDAILGDEVIVPSHSKVVATNVTLTNNAGSGMHFIGILKGDGIVASGNGILGLNVHRRLLATNVTTNANLEGGIFGQRLHVRTTALTANGNGAEGLLALSAQLQDSTLTGNNGSGTGVDIATVRRPQLTNVTCGKSAVLGGSGSWGVCSGD